MSRRVPMLKRKLGLDTFERLNQYYIGLYGSDAKKTISEICNELSISRYALNEYFKIIELEPDVSGKYNALVKIILLKTKFRKGTLYYPESEKLLKQIKEEAQKKHELHRFVSEIFNQRELQKSRTNLVKTLQKVCEKKSR